MTDASESNQHWQAEVSRDAWQSLQRVTLPDQAMRPGMVEMRLEQFALTANNVTYAVLGDALHYWDFFPASSDGAAVVPVWGIARVTSSTTELVAAGSRYYGFFPMASGCRLQPSDITGGGFVDAQIHRRGLPAVYNRYERVAETMGKDAALICLFKPLLITAAMLAERLRNALPAKGARVLITSASSKTAMLSAFCIRQLLGDAVVLVGLTAASRVGRVSQLGLFDQVFCYQDIDHLPPGQGAGDAILDISGGGSWLQQLHRQLGGSLLVSLRVGKADWQRQPEQPDAGPTPEMFFAPREVELFFANHGAAAFRQRMTGLWTRFVTLADTLCEVREADGFEQLQALWTRQLNGEISEDQAWVVRP